MYQTIKEAEANEPEIMAILWARTAVSSPAAHKVAANGMECETLFSIMQKSIRPSGLPSPKGQFHCHHWEGHCGINLPSLSLLRLPDGHSDASPSLPLAL